MGEKGQAAIEYLLLVGGAVAVVAIVIMIFVSVPDDIDPDIDAKCATYNTFDSCENAISEEIPGTPLCMPLTIDGSRAMLLNFAKCVPAT